MIVSDFDGTLFTDDYKLNDETVQAVNEYRSAGGLFFIATGRLFQAIRPYAEVLGLTDEIITYQGGGVFNLKTGKMIMSSSIESGIAEQIYSFIYENFAEYTAAMLFYNDNCIVEAENDAVIGFSKVVKVPLTVVGMPLDEYVRKNDICPNKVLTLVDPKESDRVLGALAEKFGDNININRSKDLLIEMVSPEASKGNAVKWLAEKYGIAREEIICFGDAENDNSMLEYAGLGVAMANAMDGAKAVADYITDTNNNNGVAKVIREIALKR